MYTIVVIKWDKHLRAKSYVWQTDNSHEWWVMSNKIKEACKESMKSGVIRDYRITRYDHGTNWWR